MCLATEQNREFFSKFFPFMCVSVCGSFSMHRITCETQRGLPEKKEYLEFTWRKCTLSDFGYIFFFLVCIRKIIQVIRGGDGNAGFAVRHPNGQLVKAYEWLPSSEYSEPTSTGGYYAVCLDNQFSRFASKLVNIYITVIKYDQWTKYAQEIEGLQLDMQNFTVSLSSFKLVLEFNFETLYLKRKKKILFFSGNNWYS